MINITNKEKEKLKSIKAGEILYGSCFMGSIGSTPRQLYFCSRLGIVSLESGQLYFPEYQTIIVDEFEPVDIEVTLKPFTKVV
jgi:hypothetical protein